MMFAKLKTATLIIYCQKANQWYIHLVLQKFIINIFNVKFNII